MKKMISNLDFYIQINYQLSKKDILDLQNFSIL